MQGWVDFYTLILVLSGKVLVRNHYKPIISFSLHLFGGPRILPSVLRQVLKMHGGFLPKNIFLLRL